MNDYECDTITTQLSYSKTEKVKSNRNQKYVFLLNSLHKAPCFYTLYSYSSISQ